MGRRVARYVGEPHVAGGAPVAMRNVIRRWVIAGCVAMLPIGTARAITDEDIFKNSRFNFGNPGARALAMGGAFIAIADDATAAQANPARLPSLTKPQVFLEFRRRQTADSGHQTGIVRTIPSDPSNEGQVSISNGVSQGTESTPSLASFAWPLKKYHDLAVAFSVQEILNLDSRTSNAVHFVPTFDLTNISPPHTPARFGSTGDIKAGLQTLGVSAGFRLTSRISLGGSLVLARLGVRSEVNGFFSDPKGYFQGSYPPTPTTPFPIVTTRIDDSDLALGGSLGVFVDLGSRFSLGAVYKKDPRLQLHETVTDLSTDPRILGARPKGTLATSFDVPDVEGVGLAFIPFITAARGLTFALDVVRVENRQFVRNLNSQVNVVTLNDFIKTVQFTADDTLEIHLGGEYYLALERGMVLAFRAGAYTDPDGGIHSTAAKALYPGLSRSLSAGDPFPSRGSVTHATAGLGVTPGPHFEITAAFDHSSLEDQALLSMIWRLK